MDEIKERLPVELLEPPPETLLKRWIGMQDDRLLAEDAEHIRGVEEEMLKIGVVHKRTSFYLALRVLLCSVLRIIIQVDLRPRVVRY
jgi:hypothetical protein